MKIVVHGGRRADGEVVLQGSKNAALPMLAAGILTSDEIIFQHCPNISDVCVMTELMKNLGIQTTWEDTVLRVQANKLEHSKILQKEAGRVRASILFLGSLLARTGKAKVHMPGGCSIGKRPIDIHIAALSQSGVEIHDEGEWLVCRCKKIPDIVKIRFSYPSVGATENLILFHAVGKSRVTLENCAKEPEIYALCQMLRDMGAKIEGETTGTIYIRGVKRLHGAVITIPDDRIAFMTYAAMAIGTQGKIGIHTQSENFLTEQRELEKAGCRFTVNKKEILAQGNQGIKAIPYLKTAPYPGFPTDAQSLFLTLMSRAHGESVLCETVFENRFQIIRYLKKMGADIDMMSKCAYVHGVTKLHGETVQATDLRSGAALLLAGAMAEGETVVEQAENI
ncbi:MAG: UDP-N-acetylglucosamine 1-carboxyvinyltransferase, partial [Eubacterium sp.]